MRPPVPSLRVIFLLRLCGYPTVHALTSRSSGRHLFQTATAFANQEAHRPAQSPAAAPELVEAQAQVASPGADSQDPAGELAPEPTKKEKRGRHGHHPAQRESLVAVAENAGASPAAGVAWRDLGTGSRCRGQQTAGKSQGTATRKKIDNLATCQKLCEDAEICTGVEYREKARVCELWRSELAGPKGGGRAVQCLALHRPEVALHGEGGGVRRHQEEEKPAKTEQPPMKHLTKQERKIRDAFLHPKPLTEKQIKALGKLDPNVFQSETERVIEKAFFPTGAPTGEAPFSGFPAGPDSENVEPAQAAEAPEPAAPPAPTFREMRPPGDEAPGAQPELPRPRRVDGGAGEKRLVREFTNAEPAGEGGVVDQPSRKKSRPKPHLKKEGARAMPVYAAGGGEYDNMGVVAWAAPGIPHPDYETEAQKQLGIAIQEAKTKAEAEGIRSEETWRASKLHPASEVPAIAEPPPLTVSQRELVASVNQGAQPKPAPIMHHRTHGKVVSLKPKPTASASVMPVQPSSVVIPAAAVQPATPPEPSRAAEAVQPAEPEEQPTAEWEDAMAAGQKAGTVLWNVIRSDTACGSAAGSDGPGMKFTNTGMHACMRMCENSPTCTGVDFNGGSGRECELWTQKIDKVVGKDGHWCLTVKERGQEVGAAPQVASKKKRTRQALGVEYPEGEEEGEEEDAEEDDPADDFPMEKRLWAPTVTTTTERPHSTTTTTLNYMQRASEDIGAEMGIPKNARQRQADEVKAKKEKEKVRTFEEQSRAHEKRREPRKSLDASLKAPEFTSFGPGRACRLRRNDTTPDGEGTVIVRGMIQTLGKCAELCEVNDVCKGMEYATDIGRCELWTFPIGYTVKMAGYVCMDFSHGRGQNAPAKAKYDVPVLPMMQDQPLDNEDGQGELAPMGEATVKEEGRDKRRLVHTGAGREAAAEEDEDEEDEEEYTDEEDGDEESDEDEEAGGGAGGGRRFYDKSEVTVSREVLPGSSCRLDGEDQTLDAKGTARAQDSISLTACKNLCEEDDRCTAVDYNNPQSRCLLWKETVGGYASIPGHICVLFHRHAPP